MSDLTEREEALQEGDQLRALLAEARETIAATSAKLETLYESEEYLTTIYAYRDKAEKLKADNKDDYGWNFFQGIAHGIIEWQMRNNKFVREAQSLVKATLAKISAAIGDKE